MAELLSAPDLPAGFGYPPEFLRVVELGLTHLEPWIVLEGRQLRERASGLPRRFPDRVLVPFARRQDNDDVACWEPSPGAGVVVVHDVASPGWEHAGGSTTSTTGSGRPWRTSSPSRALSRDRLQPARARPSPPSWSRVSGRSDTGDGRDWSQPDSVGFEPVRECRFERSPPVDAPCFVFIAIPKIEGIVLTSPIKADDLEVIGWGELYRTRDDAEHHRF